MSQLTIIGTDSCIKRFYAAGNKPHKHFAQYKGHSIVSKGTETSTTKDQFTSSNVLYVYRTVKSKKRCYVFDNLDETVACINKWRTK